MISHSGVILSTGAFSVGANTGYLRFSDLLNSELVHLSPQKMFLHVVPSDHAGAETTDITLNLAFDSAGAGGQDIHAFTQITNTNAVENVVLPGEESTGILTSGTDLLAAPMPPWYKLTYTVDGATPRSFILYGHILFA